MKNTMITIKLMIMISVLFGSSSVCRSESRSIPLNEISPQRQHMWKEPRLPTDAQEGATNVGRRMLQTDGRNEINLQRQHMWKEPQSLTDAHQGPTRVARRIAERLQRLDARIHDNDRKPRDTDDRLHYSNEKSRKGKNVHHDGINRRDSDEKLEHFITVAIILEDLGNRQTVGDKRRFKQSRYKRLKVKHGDERKTRHQQETDSDVKQKDDARGTVERDFDENVDEDRRRGDDGLLDRDGNDKANEDLLDEDGNVIERYKKYNNNKEQKNEDYRTIENDKDNADDIQGDYESYEEIDTNESVDQKLRDEDYIQENYDTEHLDEIEDYDEKEPPGRNDDKANKEQDQKEIKDKTNCNCGFWLRFVEDVAFSIQENMIALSMTLLYFLILLCFCPIMTRCLSPTIADMTFFCCFMFPVMWLNVLLIKPR